VGVTAALADRLKEGWPAAHVFDRDIEKERLLHFDAVAGFERVALADARTHS
jgi:hypothetical protein